MADTPERKVSEAQEQGRAAARAATQSATEAVQRGAAATEQVSRASGDALREGTQAAARGIKDEADTAQQTVQHIGGTVEEGTRRLAQSGADWQKRAVQTASEQWERTARTMADAVQHTAEQIRTLVGVPTGPNGSLESLRDFQQGMGNIVSELVQTNVKATQELFRVADPAPVIRLQQRLARSYVEAMLHGSAILARTTRTAAERTLRPLEEQIERLEQERDQNADRRPGRVIDVMQREVRVARPDDSVQQVAQLMRQEDTGVLPVGEGDRLVGMVTDRDVALRLVAEGRDPARTKVREVMTPEVQYVFEDEDLGELAETMAEQQVRRLPVLNREKRLVGVVSLSDVARNGRHPGLAGRALNRIAQPGGQHTQTAAE